MRKAFRIGAALRALSFGTDIATPRLTRLWIDVDGVIVIFRAERAIPAKNEASYALRER